MPNVFDECDVNQVVNKRVKKLVESLRQHTGKKKLQVRLDQSGGKNVNLDTFFICIRETSTIVAFKPGLSKVPASS